MTLQKLFCPDSTAVVGASREKEKVGNSILVNETEILKNASRKSEEIMVISEAKARTIRLEAEDYADEKLASLEAALHKILSAIEKGREQFKPGPSKTS